MMIYQSENELHHSSELMIVVSNGDNSQVWEQNTTNAIRLHKLCCLF